MTVTPSQTLLYCCAAFIGGVAIDSALAVPAGVSLAFLFAGGFFILYDIRTRRLFWIGACCAGIALGLFLHGAAVDRNEKSEAMLSRFFGKTVRVEGVIVKEPEIKFAGAKLVVAPNGAPAANILASSTSFARWSYGDRVVLSGVLEQPIVFEDFNYREFLEKDHIFGVMKNPSIILAGKSARTSRGLSDRLFTNILALKAQWKKAVFFSVPFPHNTVLGAILLGDQGRMPDGVKTQLNQTGVRHMTAISGQHIVILIPILMAFFLGCGLWRRQALVATFAFVLFFIILTGMSSSAVRSGIMGGMLLLSQWLGRQSVSFRGLVIAASLMLAFNPLLLARDTGFQLSFLAVLGIILFSPFFQRWFSFLPNMFAIRDSVALTTAAQILTLPVLIWDFGYLSLVGPLTNILLAPAMAPLLVGGFFFLAASSIAGVLAAVVSFPLGVLMGYVMWVVRVLSRVPLASLEIPRVSLWAVAAYGAAVAWFAWRVRAFAFDSPLHDFAKDPSSVI